MINDRIIEMTRETVQTLGYICVEVRLSKKKLTVVIYKESGGVNTDDCTKVSNVLISRLDVEIENFSESFDLIVESPGAERKMKSLRELDIFKKRKMVLILTHPEHYHLKDNKWTGKVKDVNEEDETFTFSGSGWEKTVKWEDIKKIKLFFDMKEYLSKSGG